MGYCHSFGQDGNTKATFRQFATFRVQIAGMADMDGASLRDHCMMILR
jgi:hypothetical protein